MGETKTDVKPEAAVEELEAVTIRFAGDSGDGIQLTGMQFTTATALAGNDLSTLPDYPAEIRAPAGTLPGVSGYQIHFSSREVLTPGDAPDVLVAMNPASLKANLKDLKKGGILLVNTDSFTPQNLTKVQYAKNPLEDGSLSEFRLIPVELSRLTGNALSGLALTKVQVERCKNFFALGMMFWLYDRPMESTLKWIGEKFKKTPLLVEANTKALHAGNAYAETAEIFGSHYKVRKAPIVPGVYRNITGNQAAALGMVAASQVSGLPLFYGTYPITPASDILHELSKHKNFGVRTFQAEDEIAAVGAAIGASFGGALGVTGTSGPGVALKSEAIGLAVMTELPLVIVDVQRGGPSTGLPTKTEQADLLQCLYGRNGECPIPIVAAATPAECFTMAYEAFRIAIKYMTPVFLLTDGYLANGSEPWLVPEVSKLPRFESRALPPKEQFKPYSREEGTLARPWAVPGISGYEHRIGGLEKQDVTGNVSYDPDNHERMVRLRHAKVNKIAQDIPPTEIIGAKSGKVLVIGWGSTFGAITAAVRQLRQHDEPVGAIHLRYLNPLPPDLGDIMGRFEQVLVPEMNMGQLLKVLRAKYLVPAVGLNKIKGQPFKIAEVANGIVSLLKNGRN
ncbi:MAG: 2-oxoacid:acceptor oxidoreductase subunit alpha [Elusimicrobia bacterium]|nr:2-oxoacid:acceptor oxidoreductase subunit alpha [Elusimicrobiota bacterium]MDE2236799.1 2-oxoacid:acceptor oxidoreductase subunit alpha [Elusimicrobiota bacterium]MDE2426144.1 2-oxoacid:acceptor oxidoreductase subunit alpha [Elusimicrobiota bacterium]